VKLHVPIVPERRYRWPMAGPTRRLVQGAATLRSPWFSNRWELFAGGERLAVLERHPRDRTSSVYLGDGARWRLVPSGWGVVRLLEEGRESARIIRRSWWGRRWDITAVTWAYQLVSDPMPRRWHFAVGHQPVARLSGSPISYNRLTIDADLGLPLEAAVLAWQVVARPWEAAAHPAGLIPVGLETAPRPGPAAGAV